MRSLAVAPLLPLLLAAAPPAWAHRPLPPPSQAGALVSLTVDVEGAAVPLYAATDGSGRHYVEARRGARYTLRLANRTAERLAVLMTVDGLNVISGERQAVHQRGRMYVLDPWETADIQGWRTSLEDVRRFTFVDEKASYAARSGQANSRMGWIELAVYRERHRAAWRPQRPDVTTQDAPASAPPAPEARERGADSAAKAGRAEGAQRESYPGTGWGEPARDPVRLVDFDPEPRPAERITLRYEYAPALRALGILPWHSTEDRLRQRERGQGGFARPPRW
jgi:hypothetical protein